MGRTSGYDARIRPNFKGMLLPFLGFLLPFCFRAECARWAEFNPILFVGLVS